MVFVRHAGRRSRLALTAALVSAVMAPASFLVTDASLYARGAAPSAVQSGAITGRVTDAQTGRAIAGAVVVVIDDEAGTQRVGVTDGAGRFEITGLGTTSFTLRASAVGYVGRRYGQRHTLDAGVQLTLAEREITGNLDFALRREGTVSGRVLDVDGNPMELAEVEALRPRLQGSQRVLVPIGSAQSAADGRFTIGGLPAGSYYVGAVDPTTGGTTGAAEPVDWRHTFYPGVAAAVDAARVRLEPGGVVRDLEFSVQRITEVQVSGRLQPPEGIELRSGAVALSPESRGGINLGRSLSAVVRPDGSFQFGRVQPGSYRIRGQASAVESPTQLFGTFLIAVEDRDLVNVALSLNRGTRLEGRLEFASSGGAQPPDIDGVWINAPMGNGALSWGMTATRAGADGTFGFDSPEGARVIRPVELPPPWSLERVLHRGRDITDSPLDFVQGQTYTDLRVIFTDQTSRLTGLVTNEAGDVVSDRAVVTLSANPALRHAGSRHVRLVYPDLNGRYDIRGLPAGRYVVAVVEELYEGELFEREVFDLIAVMGEETTLARGETTTLDLTVGSERERLAQ